MDFNQYQEFTRETAVYPKEWKFEYLGFGLGSEVGEIQGKLKKIIRDDTKAWMAYTDGGFAKYKEDLSKEIGDVLWYIARLVDELDIELSDIAEQNIEKLFSRKERGVLGGSGDNR